MTETPAGLETTPLHPLHLELKARMVPFAGYDMPVQYPAGILKEHLHARASAGLFDVSHMGQVVLRGDGVAQALETLVPGEIQALKPGRMRYTLFLDEHGGILDDLMVTNMGDHLFLVVNAACKQADIAHMRDRLPPGIEVGHLEDRALLALQGPLASAVLARLDPDAATMKFMSARTVEIDGAEMLVTRSGYTGEDGYEISLPAGRAEAFARRLLAEPEVEAVGLGARDSLRLEAGLCLYGHDIDRTTTPVEANLSRAIGKRRRAEGGFPGAEVVLRQIAEGPARLRVGILPEGRAPAREHTPITAAGADGGETIGEVTSGGFGPTVNRPVAMGYVPAARAAAGTPLTLLVRGKALPARVAELPFVAQRYYRG